MNWPGQQIARREFLKHLRTLGIASSLPSFSHSLLAAEEKNSVIRNRAPLAPNAFYLLPLGSIKPQGWLLRQLQIQASGLTGHLDETWADVGPNSGWLGGTGESWERGPYYLDGLVPLAYLLDDAKLKAKAQRYIDWVLTHQQSNGMIGPASNDDWWPRIVILKVLTQYSELTSDPRVIPLMDRYFRYQLSALPQRPLRDWGKFRWQDEALSVLWLYNRTGEPYLLDLAKLLHQQGHDWEAQYANFKYTQRITPEYIKLNEDGGLKDLALSTHGVNNGQAIKTGAIWSEVTGSDADRKAVLQMIAELDKYHGLPNGMFSCDEHFAGLDPTQGSELCTVVEYMFSLEQALAVTGEASLGDRLERLAYNALPGTLTDDMWAHQYNQEPNQVECSLHHKPWTTDGPESNLFGLEPNFGCCTANYHQGWPKFANSLWMTTGTGDGLVAAAYAPSDVHTVIAGVPIHLIEETEYPFRGSISITVHPEKATKFPLHLRIPAWAQGAEIHVNGQPQPTPQAGSFAAVDRSWKPGDRVEIAFPMRPRTSRWFHDSVAVERGPLVFSYGIGEDWVKLRDRGMTADWQIYPTTPWNYALTLDPDSPEKHVSVEEAPIGPHPFARKETSVSLKVKAHKVTDWQADDGATNPLPQSPVAVKTPEETITLIPYAAAKLRITAFPLTKTET
jgi:DUF1680 family protein